MAQGDKVSPATFRSFFSSLQTERTEQSTGGGQNTAAIKNQIAAIEIPSNYPVEGATVYGETVNQIKSILTALSASYYMSDYGAAIPTMQAGQLLDYDTVTLIETQVNSAVNTCAHDSSYNSSHRSGYVAHNYHDGDYSNDSHRSSNNSHDSSFRMSWGSYSGSCTGTCSSYRSGGR